MSEIQIKKLRRTKMMTKAIKTILTTMICMFFVLYVNYYNKNIEVYKVEKHVWEKKEAVDKDGKESKSTVINIFNKGDIWQIDYYHTEFGKPDYIEEIK